jgi:hypothetical protein
MEMMEMGTGMGMELEMGWLCADGRGTVPLNDRGRGLTATDTVDHEKHQRGQQNPHLKAKGGEVTQLCTTFS